MYKVQVTKIKKLASIINKRLSASISLTKKYSENISDNNMRKKITNLFIRVNGAAFAAAIKIFKSLDIQRLIGLLC